MTHLAPPRTKQRAGANESPMDPAYLLLAGPLEREAPGQRGLPALRRLRLLVPLSITRAALPDDMAGREVC